MKTPLLFTPFATIENSILRNTMIEVLQRAFAESVVLPALFGAGILVCVKQISN